MRGLLTRGESWAMPISSFWASATAATSASMSRTRALSSHPRGGPDREHHQANARFFASADEVPARP